jgi:hypothetical protein
MSIHPMPATDLERVEIELGRIVAEMAKSGQQTSLTFAFVAGALGQVSQALDAERRCDHEPPAPGGAVGSVAGRRVRLRCGLF